MSDDGLRQQWLEWARGQAIPAGWLEPAVDAAPRVSASGASVNAAAAAARLAGRRAQAGDPELLQRELARAGVALEELGGLAPAGALTAEALAAARAVFGSRQEALAGALRPAAASPPGVQTQQTPPLAATPPAAPSLREFFSEHSILLLSYVGAFLLIVAAVLYEVYAIGQLSGGLRFAGVLGLDLVFAAAGWACLRSRSMRLVGSAYVAIFALLAPLVGVAAYVFLGLHERGISVQLAVFLTAAALTVLYGALCLRLRSHAYGYLALVALAVAWLGGIAAAGAGAWNGPAAAPLVAAYALVALAARRAPGLGDRFSGRAALFAHGAAVLAVAVGLGSAQPLSWASAATLALLGAAYLLARRLDATPGAGHLGLAAIGLGWGVAAHELGLGGWTAPAAVLLVAAYSLLGRSGTPLAAAGRDLVHPAGGAAVLLGAGLWAGDVAAGHRTAWWLPAGLVLLAAAYLLHRALAGRGPALLVAAVAASLAVVAGNAALGLGYSQAAAELLVLAAGWGLAAEAAGDPVLRAGLRTGMAVQALVPVLFVSLPPPAAATALLASTALLAATAWRTRTPAWLLLAGGVFSADWYWLGRAVLPPRPPSATALALLLSPLPALLGLIGVALRAALGRAWAWPLYAVAGAVTLVVLTLSGTDTGLAGRALMTYAAVAYAAAAVERSPIAIALAIVGGGVGLALALTAAGTAPVWVLLALTALAVAVYAVGRLAWRRARTALEAHVSLGLAGSGLAALAGFTLSDAAQRGAPDALLAALAVLAFAGLLAAEARLRPMALLDHAAVVVLSFASYFVARFLGATNPQWYVAAPGLALLGTGLAIPHDRRQAVDGRVPLGATTAGAVLLLGTTAVQAFGDAGWAYTAWLVAEAVTAVLVGIVARSRALVVAGAAAVGVGGLRALFVLVQQGLLFAAFGAAAIFLLGLGAALAALRDRVRGPLGTAWREWS
jgi:hypothetical protein